MNNKNLASNTQKTVL